MKKIILITLLFTITTGAFAEKSKQENPLVKFMTEQALPRVLPEYKAFKQTIAKKREICQQIEAKIAEKRDSFRDLSYGSDAYYANSMIYALRGNCLRILKNSGEVKDIKVLTNKEFVNNFIAGKKRFDHYKGSSYWTGALLPREVVDRVIIAVQLNEHYALSVSRISDETFYHEFVSEKNNVISYNLYTEDTLY